MTQRVSLHQQAHPALQLLPPDAVPACGQQWTAWDSAQRPRPGLGPRTVLHEAVLRSASGMNQVSHAEKPVTAGHWHMRPPSVLGFARTPTWRPWPETT